MLEENCMKEKVAGSTAVVVLIKDNTLYCANVGDSRAIASVSGTVSLSILLTFKWNTSRILILRSIYSMISLQIFMRYILYITILYLCDSF